MRRSSFYQAFQSRCESVKNGLLSFLVEQKRAGKRVARLDERIGCEIGKARIWPVVADDDCAHLRSAVELQLDRLLRKQLLIDHGFNDLRRRWLCFARRGSARCNRVAQLLDRNLAAVDLRCNLTLRNGVLA